MNLELTSCSQIEWTTSFFGLGIFELCWGQWFIQLVYWCQSRYEGDLVFWLKGPWPWVWGVSHTNWVLKQQLAKWTSDVGKVLCGEEGDHIHDFLKCRLVGKGFHVSYSTSWTITWSLSLFILMHALLHLSSTLVNFVFFSCGILPYTKMSSTMAATPGIHSKHLSIFDPNGNLR